MASTEILDLIKWLLLIIALFIIGHRIGIANRLLIDIKLFIEGIMEDYKEEDDKTED